MDPKKARIIFMGTSFFAKKILENLLENKITPILVVTQPDKLAGRKKELKPSEIKILAQKNKLNLKQFFKLDETAFKEIHEINPDLIIVIAYGLIIPKKFLKIPRFGFINVHPSLLPELRGPSPIQTALLNGLKETGVTIMELEAGVDSGAIIKQEKNPIDENDNYTILEKKLLKTTHSILSDTLKKYLNNQITPREQDHQEATFSKIIDKKDGQLNWQNSSDQIFNKFRAYYQWPQIYSFWKNKKGLKKITFIEIKKCSDSTESKQNGEIYQKNNKILIKTSEGSINIIKLKLEGKKELLIKDFINGNPDFIKSVLI